MKMKIFLTFMLCFILSSCETIVRKSDVQDPIVIHPPKPEPLNLGTVTWGVWNRETIIQMANKLQESDANVVVAVISLEDLKVLLLNGEEYERYIAYQNAIIAYYQALFPPQKSTKDK